jgi:hypothetical protein
MPATCIRPMCQDAILSPSRLSLPAVARAHPAPCGRRRCFSLPQPLSLPLGTLSPRFSHYRDRPQQQPPETARSPCRVPKADPARPCAADRPGRQQPSAMSTSPKRDAATPPGTCMHPSSSTDRAKPKSEHPTRPTHTAARPTVSPGIIELQCIRFSLPH